MNAGPSIWDSLLGMILDKFLNRTLCDYRRDIMEADAFDCEEAIIVPMSVLRISHRMGILDAKESCVGPWCFYGPSMPEVFKLIHISILKL